jgi:hypothetical protein
MDQQAAGSTEATQVAGEQGNVVAVPAAVAAVTQTADGSVAPVSVSSSSDTSNTSPATPVTPTDLSALGITTNGPESEGAARQWLFDKGYSSSAAAPVSLVPMEPLTLEEAMARGVGAHQGADPNVVSPVGIVSASVTQPSVNPAPLDAGTKATPDAEHPAHSIITRIEKLFERVSTDFLKEGKALVALARTEINKLL